MAASADYPEMVTFLIESGADFHATTKDELQTPLHFAARNEAWKCVNILLAYGANLEARDYKLRTPLQVFRCNADNKAPNSFSKMQDFHLR